MIDEKLPEQLDTLSNHLATKTSRTVMFFAVTGPDVLTFGSVALRPEPEADNMRAVFAQLERVRAAGFFWRDVPAELRLMPDHDRILHVEYPDHIQTLTRAVDSGEWLDVTPKRRCPYPPLLPFPPAKIGNA